MSSRRRSARWIVSDVEFLYAVASGPPAAAGRIARLGLWSEASVLICSRESLSPAALRPAVESSARVSKRGAVAIDPRVLFSEVPGALCVAAPQIAAVGMLRVVMCVEEARKSGLTERLCSAGE